MYGPRSAHPRRYRRRVRVVDATAHQLAQDHCQETVWSWEVVSDAATRLRDHFPDFYATHVAQQPLTDGLRLGIVAAFFHLVSDAGLDLRVIDSATCYDDAALDLAPTPEQTLIQYGSVSDEYLAEEMMHHLSFPRPNYYGRGVQAIIDGHRTLDPLTALLWRLFAGTGWSTGVDLDRREIVDVHGYPLGEVADLIRQQTPLRQWAKEHACELDTTVESAFFPIPEAEDHHVAAPDLVAYAFGRTNNPLANHDNYEATQIEMGVEDEQWDWDSWRQLIPVTAEAQRLEHAYACWMQRVLADPMREIPAIVAMIRKALRRRRSAHKPQAADHTGRPLIELLASEEIRR